jgi:hypothetical protein
VPNCGTQFRVPGHSAVKPAEAGLAKSVKVEFAGVAKSTWKCHVLYVPENGTSTNEFGAPAGGSE